MEKLFTNLLKGFIKLIKAIFGLELTQTNALVIIFFTLIVVIIILAIALANDNNRRKKLKRRVLNNEIQVVTIAKGKKGKTRKIIRTKADLANPKKNKKTKTVVIATGKKGKRNNVIHINED